jgi:hypothetical protein
VPLSRAQARDARRLAALAPTAPRLHMGCGVHTMPGWVNIDVWDPHATAPEPPGTIVINHDLTLGLPLGGGVCAEIYSSHFLEHLTDVEGARLLRECHRVLARGARIRTCVPDFAKLARAYIDGDRDYFAPLYEIFAGLLGDGVAGSETIMDAVNNGLYQFGQHRCMYDMEKLERLLAAIGFTRVTPSEFDPSIDGDWDARQHFSLYIDAWR